jgi:hypothetical protein
MNKRSMKKARPAKATRTSTVRKASARKTSTRKTSTRQAPARKAPARQPVSQPDVATTITIGTVTIAQIVARSQPIRSHRYRVGQTVFYTSSPISRPGASGSYEVVRLLPSDGEDYQYRIKHSGEAFERVAKESQLEVEP